MNLVGKLHIDGIFEGRISSLDSVTVGRRGVVRGGVRAHQISVSGVVDADIHCDELTIERDGRVHGIVHSRQLTIHKHGHFIGERVMTADLALKSLQGPDSRDETDVTDDQAILLDVQAPSPAMTDRQDAQDLSHQVDLAKRSDQPEESGSKSDKLARMLDEMLGELPQVGSRSAPGEPR